MAKITNDLLNGTNVTVDQLSKYISQQGVCVEVNVGRHRNKVQLPKEIYGTVDAQYEKEDNEFFDEYIHQGSISLIPKSDEKKLISLETSVRAQVARLAVACNGKFMTSDIYTEEYLPYFNKKKTEYFEKRDEILAKWETLMDVFDMKLDAYLARHNISNQAQVKAQIMNCVPSKKKFEDSFYMQLRLTAFPVEENVDMFNSTLAKQVKESINESKLLVVKEMLGTLLGTTFTRVNDFINFYAEKGIINNQQMKPIKNLKAQLIKNNILNHDLINEIIDQISVLEKMPIVCDDDYDMAVEQAEVVLARTYGFIKDTGLDEYLDLSNPAMSELDMARLYSVFNPNSVFAQEMITA